MRGLNSPGPLKPPGCASFNGRGASKTVSWLPRNGSHKSIAVAVYIDRQRLPYGMPEAGIILKSQMLCSKIVGVNPDGSGAEGSAFIPIGHEIQSSISVDENRFVCTGPFEGDIWSGDD